LLYLVLIIGLPFLLLRYAFKIGAMPSLAVSCLVSPATAYGVVAVAYFGWGIPGSGPLVLTLVTGCLLVGVPAGLVLLLMWGPFRLYDKFCSEKRDRPREGESND